jgi:hypothetical protein
VRGPWRVEWSADVKVGVAAVAFPLNRRFFVKIIDFFTGEMETDAVLEVPLCGLDGAMQQTGSPPELAADALPRA